MSKKSDVIGGKGQVEPKTSEEISFEYQEYGLCKDSRLTKDAQDLKRFILKAKWVSFEDYQALLAERDALVKRLAKIFHEAFPEVAQKGD